jgi:ABC-2 type transport system ATP-binding protein
MADGFPACSSLRALTKRYDGGLLARDGFELEIPDGAFLGLLGPTGAGKTTPTARSG